MDKERFLAELRRSIRVLEEEEIQDIIGEYEQHIDLKVQKGQTVEQAIADFGNLKELVTEILEGYHVNVDFVFGNEEKETKKEKFPSTNKQLQKFFGKGKEGILTAGNGIVHGFIWLGKQVRRPFFWINKKVILGKERHKGKKLSKKMNQIGVWLIHNLKGIGKMMLQLGNWLIRISVWCLRLLWNGCVITAALVSGAMGLFALFMVGILGVLLLQGYPLIGVTVGCLGLVLCLLAVTLLLWTMLWHEPKVKQNSEKPAEATNTNFTEVEGGSYA